MKLLVTGGHVTPAVAVIDEIRKRYPRWEIVFVGRKHAFEGSPVLSTEYRVVSDRGIRFIPLTTGRAQRFVSWFSVLSLLKAPVGFFQSFRILVTERPKLVVSFGGYIALPIVCAGSFLGIPAITHEQTTRPGLANRIIALVARRICVTFPNTSSLFPLYKTVVTGLPMRQATFRREKRSVARLKQKKLLFICGGSTGARSLNDLLYPIIPFLARDYHVVHQVGQTSLRYARTVRQSFPSSVKARYTVLPYLNEKDYARTLVRSTLVIGRAGANTVIEIAALGKVAILVPLPWSGAGEQEANAKFLSDLGIARVLNQRTLTSEAFLEEVHRVSEDLETYEDRAKKVAHTIPRDGASLVVDEIVRLIRQ